MSGTVYSPARRVECILPEVLDESQKSKGDIKLVLPEFHFTLDKGVALDIKTT